MPDLGVYNLTTLTGLLGPAKAVVALTGIITPTRQVDNKGKIKVEAEDNTMVMLDHGNGTFSHVQCGFNYFDPHGHDGSELDRHSISIVGKKGSWSWSATTGHPTASTSPREDQPRRSGTAPSRKAGSGSKARRSSPNAWPPARSRSSPPEHSLHIVEIIEAARTSGEGPASASNSSQRSSGPWCLEGRIP